MNRQRTICIALAIITLALYLPVIGHNFVNYDDNTYVTQNLHVQSGLTPASVLWAFTTTEGSNWHPVTWLSHMLDVQFYGLKPGLHHLTNVIFHVANTVLLFLLLRFGTGSLRRSALVAGLFAWHPLHVESVAWVAERKDVLSTFFWLLTLLAYGKYAKDSKASNANAKIFYGLSLLCFGVGLLAKPMLVTLPFLLFLLDFWPLERFRISDHPILLKNRSLLWEKVPFFALAVFSCIITVVAQTRGGAVASVGIVSLHNRVSNALVSYVGYMIKMLWPINLTAYYPMVWWPNWMTLTSGIILLVLTLFAIISIKQRPYVTVGWFGYLGTLVPVIGLVQVGAQSMADRYSYVSLIGLFIIFAWSLPSMEPFGNRAKMVVCGVGGIFTLCLILTTIQLRYWASSETLWRHALAVNERNSVANSNLGAYLAEHGQISNALNFYKKALEITPALPEANYNLAILLNREGHPNDAANQFQKLLQYWPNYVDARIALATILMSQDKLSEARQEFLIALDHSSNHAEAQLNLGRILLIQNEAKEAMAHIQIAANLKPNWVPALKSMGDAFATLQDLTNASLQYEIILKIDPTNTDAHIQLAQILTQQGHVSEAIGNYRDAIKLDGNSILALNNLAWILATFPDVQFRNGAEAVRSAQRACDLTHYQTPILIGTLAAAYAEAGRFKEAEESAQKAITLALASGNKELAARNQELLKLYREGKAFHEGSK